MIKGTDISSFQVVNFSKLKVSTDFVIIKATEGYGFVDPKFVANQTGARNMGIPLGYYCFTRPDLGNTVEAEVDFLLKTINIKDGESIYLDYEVSYAKPVAWCFAWLEYLKKKLNGYKGIVYLNQSLLTSNDWTQVISGGYGLWLAKYDYVLPTEMPQTKWGTCAFQQYSNREVVSGIASPVDADVFFGDVKAFKKYGYNPVVTVPPVTPPASCEQQLKDLEVKIDKLNNDMVIVTSDKNTISKNYKDYQDKTTKQLSDFSIQVESLQKTNAETTAQISVMSEQVKSAVKEKNLTQGKLDALNDQNKTLIEASVVSKNTIDTLNAKIKKNLGGYSKKELVLGLLGRF